MLTNGEAVGPLQIGCN